VNNTVFARYCINERIQATCTIHILLYATQVDVCMCTVFRQIVCDIPVFMLLCCYINKSNPRHLSSWSTMPTKLRTRDMKLQINVVDKKTAHSRPCSFETDHGPNRKILKFNGVQRYHSKQFSKGLYVQFSKYPGHFKSTAFATSLTTILV